MKQIPIELALEIYDQCMQCVRAYGPPTVSESDRDGIVRAMEHFKRLFERDYGDRHEH